MARTHIVVLGDVVDSQKIADRERFQAELGEVLADVNERYRGQLVADFETIKGIDEVAGVLDDPAPLYRIQREITERIHPESIRLVAVRGSVDVGADERNVSEMDGPAFAEADRLLSSVEKSGFLFDVRLRDDAYEELLADEINLIAFVKSRWTEHQMTVARLYRELGVQIDVAERLSVSQQAVSKTLRESRAKQILSIEDRIDEVFEGYNVGGVP